jgi:hypothetical protein
MVKGARPKRAFLRPCSEQIQIDSLALCTNLRLTHILNMRNMQILATCLAPSSDRLEDHMSHTASSEEMRAKALVDLTRQKSAGLLAAVRAGQPQASKLIRDCVSEYITDNHALSALILESLAGTNSLQGVITDLIWAEAEALAQLELLSIERENRELSTVDRIDRYLDSIAA